jgi:carboxypeptidase family protein
MKRLASAVLEVFAIACSHGRSATSSPTAPALHELAPTIISGMVFEGAGAPRPIPGADVWLSYSDTNASGRKTTTASDGRYEFADATKGTLSLSVVKEGYAQPCAATGTTQYNGGAEVNVELVSIDNLSLLNATAASPDRSPTLSGTVFERTPAGRVPIPRAYVVVGWWDTPVAYTWSDPAGHYLLCRVPPVVDAVGVGTADYVWGHADINFRKATDQVLDIELTRR